VKKNADFHSFFERKTKRLCEIYSLAVRPSSKQDQYENEICKIKSIKMTATSNGNKLSFELKRNSIYNARLPQYKKNKAGKYKIEFRDDVFFVCIKDDRKIRLKKWLSDKILKQKDLESS
jgi:hypothetical protein